MNDVMAAADTLAHPGQQGASFTFRSAGENLLGRGFTRHLPRGPAETLGARVAAFFAAGPDGPALLAGALPFDRGQPDYLLQPASLDDPGPLPAPATAAPAHRWQLRAEPAPQDYAAAVRQALAMMAAEAGQPGGLTKVVLARSLLARAERAIDTEQLLRRLGLDRSVTTFLVPLPEGPEGSPRLLAGATPELLLRRRGRRVISHPLAGSARRQADAAADRAAAEGLNASTKDRREHALVAEFILDTLAPHCRGLGMPEGTRLTTTASMWHLGTRIEGELRDPSMSSAALAALLHPTPAVCGVPRDRAQAAIATAEPLPRDFYAGAVGWCDASGDGAWYVAIRCAEISGASARLYAGAGIVPGSDPVAETDETAAKFGALLRALEIPLEGSRA